MISLSLASYLLNTILAAPKTAIITKILYHSTIKTMKTTFKTFSIAVIALSFLAAGCEKEKPAPIDQLPPATQTGANTFGCLVNGEVFKPSGSPLGGPVLSASYILYNGKYGLSIFARRGGGGRYRIYLYLRYRDARTACRRNLFANFTRPGKYFWEV